jgi:hypothetical protein
MKQSVTFPNRRASAVWLALFALAFQISHSEAQTYTLSDGNSTVTLNPTTQAGMNSWAVDGQNQLNQQWFWYRIGNSGPQYSIDTISTPAVSMIGTSTLNVNYTNAQFSLNTVFQLSGGAAGSGAANLNETITINNLSPSTALPFNFFEYANFQLGGMNNQNVFLTQDPNGRFSDALVTTGSIQATENVDTGTAPTANFGEAALYNTTLANLNGTPGYTLNNNTNAGLGGATWAMEWTNNIAADGTFQISKVLSIEGVPEPAVWSLISMGLIAIGAARRRMGQGQ